MSTSEQIVAQAPEFGPQMPLSEKLLAIAIRAQNFTGASGVAVAIKEGDSIVCRASWGTSAPDVGVRLQDQSSFTYQCLRAGKAMRCDDASNDSRVDAVACEALGIRAIAAAPVQSGDEVRGVIAAFSEEPHAFSDTHMVVLTTLGEVAAKFLVETPPAKPASVRSEEPLALDDLPIADGPAASSTAADEEDAGVLESLLADDSASSAASPVPTWPAVTETHAGALEKEPEVRPDEMQAPVDIRSDPALVSAAESITPSAPEKPAPPVTSGASKSPVAWPKKFSAPAQEKPAGVATPITAVQETQPAVTLPGFALSTGEDAVPIYKHKFFIPGVAAAVVLVSLLGWTVHRHRAARPVTPPPQVQVVEQTEAPEPEPPAAPQVAEMTSPPPRYGKITDASVKAGVSPKPDTTAKKRPESDEEKPEPIIATDLTVRKPGPVRTEAPEPEAPPMVTIASAALPPDLPTLGAAAPAGPAMTSRFIPSEPLHKVAPEFPDMARKFKVQGKVVLTAKIDKEGKVTDVKFVSGPPVFQQNAINAVRRWRYKPASLDGQAVESTAEITLNFTLSR